MLGYAFIVKNLPKFGKFPKHFFNPKAALSHSSFDTIICGAGITGVSSAYQLSVKKGLKVLLLDKTAPLQQTSSRSTECYRNFWFDEVMSKFMNRSIDLLDQYCEESQNFFSMNRRGYAFFFTDQKQASAFEALAHSATKSLSEDIRYHTENLDHFIASNEDKSLSGVDVVTGPLIQKIFPWVSENISHLFFARKCGWLSAQQLGMWFYQQSKESGNFQFIQGTLGTVHVENGSIQGITVHTKNSETVYFSCKNLVNASGPWIASTNRTIGAPPLPVSNEVHAKLCLRDQFSVFPSDAPMSIYTSPVTIQWSNDEIDFFKELGPIGQKLLHQLGGIHFRPYGEHSTLLLCETLHSDIVVPPDPPTDITYHEFFPEVMMRAISVLVPRASEYFGKLSPKTVSVDGGYYCQTANNRPIVGPHGPKGGFICGALSGYGIMASAAVGELLANHICSEHLPPYSSAFEPRVDRQSHGTHRLQL